MGFLDFLKRQPKGISKKDAAQLIANAWNDYDASIIESILATNFEYRSCATCKVMNGKSAYMDYLHGKFEAFKQNEISLHASVLVDKDDACVKIEDENGVQSTFLLVFEMTDGYITNMLMRPEVMYSLEDLNDQSLQDDIIKFLAEKVRSGITKQAIDAGFEENDVRWLHAWPYFNTPQFQHLCFALKASVYSISIAVYDMYNRYVALPNAPDDMQLDVCKKNDMIACQVGIDINALNDPTFISAITQEPIDLQKTANEGSGYMSDWEMNNLAVIQTLEYLVSKGCTDILFTDTPSFMPQIRFMDKGQKCFAYVYGHAVGIKDIPAINKSFFKPLEGYKGYFAELKVSSARNNGDFNETKVFRGPLHLGNNFDGYDLLMPIEDAMKLYGTTESEVHTVVY